MAKAKKKNAMCDILRQNIAYHDNINNLEAFGVSTRNWKSSKPFFSFFLLNYESKQIRNV